jgi:arsenite methyltransferase
MATDRPDRWSRWLLGRRDAGDEQQRRATLEHLGPIRDRILTNASPLHGTTLLDLGAGDGLVGLSALDRVGTDGKVIFGDVSTALLAVCRAAVTERGDLPRSEFVRTAAEDLADIPDESVDVVTTRSVLIYVTDKAGAFRAMHRVLRPGGRISLFEPLNRLMFPEPPDRFWGYDIGPVRDLADRVKTTFRELEGEAASTMTDFDDRDLFAFAERAGFREIHLDTQLRMQATSPLRSRDLAGLLDSAPSPLAPTIRECVEQALDGGDRSRFFEHLRDAFELQTPVSRWAAAFLVAAK